MASSSSSSVIISSDDYKACSYDVFLSFSGLDTRHSFTDHLYDRLKRAGIHTFRDDEEINRGEELKPEIERAIKASKASVVVLSENYATSSWCLDELLLILKQRLECNHFVLPVFYHVEPTHVRNQIGTFAIEAKPASSSTRWTDQNVDKWKKALTQIANLSGEVVSGAETNLLKKIVDIVYNKLEAKEVHLPLNMTGMATRYKEIDSWIDNHNLEFLVIYGMGGSGKTTLAKYIYNSNWKRFEYVSFVENIGSRCEKLNGLLEVQEQLLKDVLGGEKRKIPSVSRGMCMVGEALKTKRALIVLDDIAEHNKLVALLGTGEINAQSKIIITTRENIDNWSSLSSWRCQKYEMKLLNSFESSELLCHHAFRSKIPNTDFEEIVLQAVQCCEGNPLALEVLGSTLSKCNTIISWRSQMNLFYKDIHSGIQGVLKRSYKSLPSDSEKELFLHIACFFVGKDIDYVVKILERDYSAISGIKTLIDRGLLSVSPNKEIMMHRLVQEMAKNIVRQESRKLPERRSRVWLNRDSYKILRKGMGSETIEGLALDMETLRTEDFAFKSSKLTTNALQFMDNLKLLQLKSVELSGSYKYVSEELRWLCWVGFHLKSMPSDLYMGNLVALDMSCSNLEVFEPPTDLQSLEILNFKDSQNLVEIHNINRIPNLNTLILWNCCRLVHVCKTIEMLRSLELLNMTGCKNLFDREQINVVAPSTSGGVATEHHAFPFSFPSSLHRLFLNGCHLKCTEPSFLNFCDQPFLQYLNLGRSLFESLPSYNHLDNLRVLDLSFCWKLISLSLPNTLAELYVYGCLSLLKITFQSHQFTLQEFGYRGCINLNEVEGFFKLVPIFELGATDLGHMKWLKEYQNHKVCLVGDDELTEGRSWYIQMLYEFDIMSTSLPNIEDPNLTPKYKSRSSSVSFKVPLCPKHKRLKGIDVTFKYAIHGVGWVWFCKVNTANGVVDLMYNTKIFGKPGSGEVCKWLSYWPIGNKLNTGDTVNVSIVVMSGLEVYECGVSLVYSDQETLEKDMGWIEILGGDASGFQLSTGEHYLCRRDYLKLMEVGGLTPDWFRSLVGDTIDNTEVRGWRKTGRPTQVNDPLFTELKTIRSIICGPQLEDIYKIEQMPKSSFGDRTVAFTPSLLEREITNEAIEVTESEIKSLPSTQVIYDKPFKSVVTVNDSMSTSDDKMIMESKPYSLGSSISTVIASSGDKGFSYDVFISFCGNDTRHSFTDHLYDLLRQAGIRTFRDDGDINRGEQMQPVIERVIEESRGSIVVLSKNYATSTWCLNELVLILEQRRDYNHFVLPVFYHADPSDVRNQKGDFAIQANPYSKYWTDENVNKWKTALMEVADLPGHVFSGPETSFLKKIVDIVYNKLAFKELSLPLNLIGMASHEKEINSWLEQCDLQFLVIYGMGGSGKTTLAKHIYNSNWKKFEYVSFLEMHIGLHELQEQLLKDISKGKKRKIPSISQGAPMIEMALQRNRALIVLDDVTGREQLVYLLGTGKINSQSKIIVTTIENTDNWFYLSSWRCQKYGMKLLNDDESLELFCHHAFGSKTPMVDLEEIVKCALQYCGGNPMALKILGSSLKDCDSFEDKKNQTWLFERDIDSRLQDILKRSYTSLPSVTVKDLFLHIACFFNGIDMDYVGQILELDYSAISGIQTLIHKGLLSVSPNNKLMMHSLVQEMGKNIVRQESSKHPEKRSRVWLSSDSHKILRKGMGSKTIEGLALDMKALQTEDFAFKASALKTEAFKKMEILKLLQLNFVELSGSYEHVSENLRWLCWNGFHLKTVPSDLYMGNLVAIDMSYSNLEVFEPPMEIHSLKILNLKDSYRLIEIRNIFMIPNLESLILWNCCGLVNVCKTIGNLKSLSLLSMTGCKNLFNKEQTNMFGGVVTEQQTFCFPDSLHRLFLKDCHLKRTGSFPLSFTVQPDLQYLNLASSLFDSLPCYDHLQKLRVLDLSFCSRLKCLVGLPNKLAELYIYGCELLERITFQSHRFTLQELGYKGCINLYEVKGLFKLVPIARLDETDLGHLKWLQEYQNHEVCLVGDDELIAGRSRHLQILYEFDIMSTSLPDINVPVKIPTYISVSTSLSFDVPSCPKNKSLKGINVTFKYSLFGEDWAWFCKISTANGVVDWMYNPKVFGNPEVGEVCTWLSYWPIGNKLNTGDIVNVSIVVLRGLEVYECGVSIVYSDQETLENTMQWEEDMGGDLSRFQLSTGAYYLCQRDFFEQMEVGRLTLDWFRSLVGDTIDYTEVRGWRITGRPKLVNGPTFTELKTIRCIIHGPQLEDIYKSEDYSSSSIMAASAAKVFKYDVFLNFSGEDYSSSSIMPASAAKVLKYDVFLNFSGEDTRNSFSDHLRDRLKRARISTFMGEEEFNTDEELKPEIERAIEESRSSIVVLSKNYATSTWCLDELVLILEERSKGDHFVLPVFYGVQPTDIRNQKGTFDIQVKPSSKWTEVKVNKWKAALMEVANLTGLIVSGPETIILKKIVDTIYNELDR